MTVKGSTTTCTECGTACVWKWYKCWEPASYPCDACHDKVLCKACHGKYPLFIVKDTTTDSGKQALDNGSIQNHCQACFQLKSTLDFTSIYTRVPDKSNESSKKDPSGVLFVFGHGGGACRMLYDSHAKELYQRYGHASILLDFPGHGTLVDKELTVESAVQQVGNVLADSGITDEKNTEIIDPNYQKVIFVGTSLGAYLGFPIVERYQHLLAGAILIDCGQNVGPDCQFHVKMGCALLSFLTKHYSNAALMKMMINVSKKSPADYKLVETCYGAGQFFEQGEAQVRVLRTIAPAEILPKIKSVPILFMNGSEDHRNSEDKWLSLCVCRDKSELKVYEGGDHFFTHDSRFLEDIFQRIDTFTKRL